MFLKIKKQRGRRKETAPVVGLCGSGIFEGLSPGGGMAGVGTSQGPAVGNGPDRVVGTGARVFVRRAGRGRGRYSEQGPDFESVLSRGGSVQGARKHMTAPTLRGGCPFVGCSWCKCTFVQDKVPSYPHLPTMSSGIDWPTPPYLRADTRTLPFAAAPVLKLQPRIRYRPGLHRSFRKSTAPPAIKIKSIFTLSHSNPPAQQHKVSFRSRGVPEH